MSSLLAAPRPGEGAAAPEPAGAAPRSRGPLAAHPDALVTLALAALLVAVAFVARGGSALAPTTTVEIVLVLLGAGSVALAILVAPPQRRAWGGVTLLLFAALAVWTALSIAWSVEPSDSWQAANLTLAYFAAFAGTVALVHVAPARWAAVLGAVVLASVVLCGYSLLAKVFPSISSLDLYARLRAPFDYWNAVGLMAALGIPGCLWLGARRDGHAALSALAVPALGLLLVALLLSYGRGPLLAAAIAIACWFAAVPLRMRGLAVLATAGVGAIVVCAWAFANAGLTKDGAPLDVHDRRRPLARPAAARAADPAGARGTPARVRDVARDALAAGPPGARNGVLVALALVPLAGIGALAASQRGLTGSLSHDWHELTAPTRPAG